MRTSSVVFVALALALSGCGQVSSPIEDAAPPVDAGADGGGGPDAAGAVSLTVTRTGAGTVSSTPAGLACGATCTATFPAGTQVTLTAVADAGASFAGWTGACTGAQPSCTFTLAADASVTATFAPVTYTVTTSLVGNGTGTVSATPATLGLTCPGACSATVAYDTPVTLTATPTGASLFLGWSGGGCTGTGPCTVNVRSDLTINAAFALNYSLVVTRTGTGTGAVSSIPAGIACGADCDETYAANAMVTLTATADPSSTFTGWSGACTGTGSCAVTMDAAKTVAAGFQLRQHVLTASVGGTGTGTITSSPLGINCGAACTATFDHGTVVALTATAGATSAFAGWTGACTGLGACIVTMDQARTVGATFTVNSLALSVSRAGNGAGAITSTPAGITCGATCTAPFNAGTSITLTAVASTGSSFTGWSGGGCAGTGACTVTLTASTTVTATFTLDQFTVAVQRTGTGAAYGTVTSAPAGITCGTTCSASFVYGATVTLTAAGGTGAVFAGWPASTGCTGTAPCTLTVAGATTVTAPFTLATYPVTVALGGTGLGAVASSPAGISCPSTCTASAGYGSTVTLTATPAANHTFTGWSGGGCTGTGTCTVTVGGAVTVTASFAPPPNLAFVTAGVYTGNLGGLAGADAICQARAAGIGLAGTYRAWLSSSTATAPSRLGTASGWVRTDGKPFANTKADLVAGRIFYPLAVDERGGSQLGATAWTATSSSGALSGTACADWTISTSAGSGTIGFAEYGTGGWTQNGGATCDATQHLYCLGIDWTATVAPPPATNVRRAFVSSAPWVPSGGLSGADALCGTEATAAGLPGSYRALLATTGATAASRFSTTGNPWARVDDVVLATTATGFLGSAVGGPTHWQAALNVTAGRSYQSDRTWAGAGSLQSTGTGSSCNGWSTTATTAYGAVGIAASSRVATAFANYNAQSTLTDCSNTGYKVMCLQQ